MGSGGLEVGVEEVFFVLLFGGWLRVFVMLVDLLYVTFWRRAGRVAKGEPLYATQAAFPASSTTDVTCEIVEMSNS